MNARSRTAKLALGELPRTGISIKQWTTAGALSLIVWEWWLAMDRNREHFISIYHRTRGRDALMILKHSFMSWQDAVFEATLVRKSGWAAIARRKRQTQLYRTDQLKASAANCHAFHRLAYCYASNAGSLSCAIESRRSDDHSDSQGRQCLHDSHGHRRDSCGDHWGCTDIALLQRGPHSLRKEELRPTPHRAPASRARQSNPHLCFLRTGTSPQLL